MYMRELGIFSQKSFFKHINLYKFSETANISEENGVYSFLKLLLEAEIMSFKDSYLQTPTFEKMALISFVSFFCHYFFTFPLTK